MAEELCGEGSGLREPLRERLDALAWLEARVAAAATSSATSTEPNESPGPEVPAPHIPGYAILGPLGRGGMGIVYLGDRLRDRALVALQVPTERFCREEPVSARFQREAEGMARLRHPHIVRPHGWGECAGLPFLVQEYVPGPNLAQWLAGTALPLPKVVRLAITLSQTLDHVHRRGIVH